MSLRLHFLGPPRLERDGRAVDTDTRKAVALLAYLAITGEYQTRDTLAALLWPEIDDERARAALRRTLSSLRAAVGENAIYVHRDGLSLNEANVWCDATTFEAAVAGVTHHDPTTPCADCLPRMEAAAALYRDHFLSGFSLRDSAEFDAWQSATTEHLRRAYATALAWLVQTHSQAAEYNRAIDFARRWLAVDPLREEAHRRLMQLYAWSGAREAALQQYREAVRILDDELGVSPLSETTALYEAIQEGRLGLPAAPPAEQAAPGPAVEPKASSRPGPLVGRESAWNELLQAYDAVTTTGRLVAITGEAGIGKTRLVEAFVEEVRARGAVTVTVACYEGEANLAYAPIAAGLRVLLRRPDAAGRQAVIPTHWLAEAARLIPELDDAAGTVAPTQSPGAQARFFAGISETLCHLLSGERPGVLFLDDLHWADDASLDLLAYLARRLSDLPILLVASWAEDTGAQAQGSRRLRRLVADAQRAGTGHAIQLTRWRPSDVLSLVMASPHLRDRAMELTDQLYRETEGLPFFVAEYLAALDETADAWPMPQSVRELLAGRLADVDQTGRQLLQTAAVIGRSFDYATLLEASGRSEEEVVGGLERLLALGLIRELGDQQADELRYDFAHQLMRSLVYEETHLARRRLLHRRVAAALQAGARARHSDAVAGLIADHYQLGGQEATAAEFYRRAGQYARALYANREALGHFRTALALGHPDAPTLQETTGDLHTLLGEYQAALQAYEAAAAAAVAAVDLGRLEHKLGQVYERRGNWELAESHYGAALEHLGPAEHPVELARLNVDRSRVVYRRGDPALAVSLGREALAQAEAAADPVAEAQAHNTLGILARQRGQTEVARAHLERSLALAEASGHSPVRVAALNNLAHLLESDGQAAQALALLDQALALCIREGDRHHEAALHNHRADILHRAGQDDAAMSSLKQAVAIYAEIGLESGDWQPEIWKMTEW